MIAFDDQGIARMAKAMGHANRPLSLPSAPHSGGATSTMRMALSNCVWIMARTGTHSIRPQQARRQRLHQRQRMAVRVFEGSGSLTFRQPSNYSLWSRIRRLVG